VCQLRDFAYQGLDLPAGLLDQIFIRRLLVTHAATWGLEDLSENPAGRGKT
jgi:hypothetical protein